jgi:hypothetical protein
MEPGSFKIKSRSNPLLGEAGVGKNKVEKRI